jgi:hypothetical protein
MTGSGVVYAESAPLRLTHRSRQKTSDLLIFESDVDELGVSRTTPPPAAFPIDGFVKPAEKRLVSQRR